MINKKASASLIFLVVSILVISSSLIITVHESKKSDNEDNTGARLTLLNNIGYSFIPKDEAQETEDNYENYLSSGSNEEGSKKKSKAKEILEKFQNIDLLKEYETNHKQFKEIEIQNKIVYFYQRMIGDAIVEKDFKVYQFDKNTGNFLKKNIKWRDDLSEYLSPSIIISKEQAESMVEGEIKFSKLYIISPESDVFPIKPTPKNPSWVVASINDSNMIITIIDSLNGKILGYGIPPPSSAFSLTGPTNDNPCGGGWYSWAENARDWFNTMGYDTEYIVWPIKEKIQSHIQSNETLMFYEIAHGNYLGFASGCIGGTNYEFTYAWNIKEWINQKKPLTFLGSCDAMCDTGNNTLSYEFRKGSNENTVTIGYCGMEEEYCNTCWSYSNSWQNTLFDYMNQGWKVKDAFDQANADYPACEENNCMRFAGDENFKVVLCEEEWSSPYCKDEDIYHNKTCNNLIDSTWLKEEEKVQDCGEDEHSNNYCYDNDVYKNFTDRGCSLGSCFEDIIKQKVQECEFGCEQGACLPEPQECETDADCGIDYCEDWQDDYCEEENVYHNRTCHDKGCSSGTCYDNIYIEKEKVQDCGGDEYSNNYCYDNDVYKNFTDRGCSLGSCFEDIIKQKVQECEYGCSNGECKKPDLIVTDLSLQSVRDKTITLGFTITNIGNAIADSVYWVVDTNSPEENPERTSAISLEPEDWTRAYMMWTYSQSGSYNPKVIVDFDNLINESNENNNEESISLNV